MQRKPEDVAAVVNALVVLLGPPLLMIAGSMLFPNPSSTNTSTVVVGVDPNPVGSAVAVFAPMLMALAPLALIAGWRTHVHARRWRDGRGRGWRGVAEAAAVAGGIALIVLSPGILTRPLEAPPFLLVYGGAAIVLGLLVGVILRFTALLTLKRFSTIATS